MIKTPDQEKLDATIIVLNETDKRLNDLITENLRIRRQLTDIYNTIHLILFGTRRESGDNNV